MIGQTCNDFRRDNRGAFRAVFRQLALLCRRLDLYDRELLGVDGTRMRHRIANTISKAS
jgi:hypothetical protein